MEFFKKLSRKLSARVVWRPKQPGTVSVPSPEKVNQEVPFKYLLNDMTTPDFFKMVVPPKVVIPNINVVKFAGGGDFTRGSWEYTASHCYFTIANTLQYFLSQGGKPFSHWARSSAILVNSQAGSDLNAFYDRHSLQFFSYTHPRIGGTVYTAESADIVAHETGHAILDMYRPEAFSAASLEVWAFHEAFADLTAMFHALSFDEVIAKVIQETGGNLRKQNVVSRLAEHVGRAVFMMVGSEPGRSSEYLRSAINGFQYVDPGTLPKDGPDDRLAAECHNFGRVYLGVFYDLLISFYEKHLANGLSQIESLKQARNDLAKRVIIAIQYAPLNVRFYEAISKAMLWADLMHFGGTYQIQMHQIFAARNVFKPEIKILSAPDSQGEPIVKTGSIKSLKLSDYVMRAQSDNPLYDVEIEVPEEATYFYDANGYPVAAAGVDEEETLRKAQDTIHYLHEANLVGNDHKKPFRICDGKLVRTFIN